MMKEIRVRDNDSGKELCMAGAVLDRGDHYKVGNSNLTLYLNKDECTQFGNTMKWISEWLTITIVPLVVAGGAE